MIWAFSKIAFDKSYGNINIPIDPKIQLKYTVTLLNRKYYIEWYEELLHALLFETIFVKYLISYVTKLAA